MSCDLGRTVLHGYLDGELDAARAAEFESHLEHCAECAAALAAQESLRSSMNRAQLYEKAPAALRKRVLADVRPAAPVVVFPRRMAWGWLAAAAVFLLVAYMGWRAFPALHGGDNEAVLTAQVVDAHLRSLQPGHLTDVVSSDQHTVKPWFDGKLDFAPPVRDFADQGFPLQGGRLDIIRGRTVAALVYGRRKHFVNVFVWPMSEKDSALRSGSQQGYQWVAWRKGGMEFWAVSDAASSDLEELQHLFVQ